MVNTESALSCPETCSFTGWRRGPSADNSQCVPDHKQSHWSPRFNGFEVSGARRKKKVLAIVTCKSQYLDEPYCGDVEGGDEEWHSCMSVVDVSDHGSRGLLRLIERQSAVLVDYLSARELVAMLRDASGGCCCATRILDAFRPIVLRTSSLTSCAGRVGPEGLGLEIFST